MTRDIWFIFGLVIIVLLFEYAPKVAGIFVLLLVTYVVVKPLGPIFRD